MQVLYNFAIFKNNGFGLFGCLASFPFFIPFPLLLYANTQYIYIYMCLINVRILHLDEYISFLIFVFLPFISFFLAEYKSVIAWWSFFGILKTWFSVILSTCFSCVSKKLLFYWVYHAMDARLIFLLSFVLIFFPYIQYRIHRAISFVDFNYFGFYFEIFNKDILAL